MLRVGFQGERGAYSEAAAVAHFGEAIEPVPHAEFDGVFEAVESGACAFGIVPIENSLAGSIHRNYDLLLRHPLHIAGEHVLRVRHCLIVHPDADIRGIRAVVSHPQALAQCERYLRELGVERVPAYDTAGAVLMIRESGDRSHAAIASARAAEVHGMRVAAEGIEDDEANFTRFLVLARDPARPEGPAKTSLVVTLKNAPGSLFKALSVFALRDIDLSKLESRPIHGRPWEYRFYMDVAGNLEDEAVRRGLEHLKEIAIDVRVLGSYSRHSPEA